MKYILFHDVQTVLKKLLYLFLLYILVLIFYKYHIQDSQLLSNHDKLYYALGYLIPFESSIEMMIYTIETLFYIYMTYLLFTRDLTVGSEIIFTRIRGKKWLTFKMVSILFQITLCKIILTAITFLLFNTSAPLFLFDFGINLLQTYTICLGIIMFLILASILTSAIWILPIGGFMIATVKDWCVLGTSFWHTTWWWLGIGVVFIFLFNQVIGKQRLKEMIERSNL